MCLRAFLLLFHFRRQSGNARLSIFDGGHEKDAKAAFY